MDNKILILGVKGMLGHKLYQLLRTRFPQVIGVFQGTYTQLSDHKDIYISFSNIIEGIDVTDHQKLERVLVDIRPSTIINCIGVIKQRAEAKSAIPSITINALLPHKLAEMCQPWGGKLIHFSTDCVFSGKRGGYTEADPSDADDLYGRTKYLGEVQINNALTLRTSIIGRELTRHSSLLDWFLSQNGKTVKGYKRAFYSGVTTNHLATVVGDIIEKFPKLSGLYQVVSQPISKYDLLGLIRNAYQLDIEILPDEEFYCDRTMKGDKFYKATGYVCPSWPELVSELAADPTNYKKWRQ